MKTQNQNYTMNSAEPFYFAKGRIGALLVHGFTGTPKEMLPLGEYLAQKNLSVLGIRLAGHATQMEDIRRVHWLDWMANIEDGLVMLRNITDHQFIIGLSMGGILSLIASAHYKVDGAIILSAPYSTDNDWRKKLLPVIKYFVPDVQKGPSDWHNKEAEREHVSYPVYPTVAVQQYLAAQDYMQTILPKVNVPTLLIYSKLDMTANPASLDKIYDQLGTQTKEKVWLENSGHIITREPENDLVFRSSYEFIKNQSRSITDK